MRIAFFGLPLAAVLLAHDGHDIVYAAACRPGPGLRRLASQIAPGRTWLRPNLATASEAEKVRKAAPDLLISWFWTAKVPPQILRLAPGVGVHPSLLPRHRGPDPIFWAIDCGDVVSGVTAHKLETEYDTGAILGRREVRIEPEHNAWALARALDRPSLSLLREIAGAYSRGTPPLEVPQDESAATDAPEPGDEELSIRWSNAAASIERRVRAAAPWPGAWTELGDQLVTLVRVRVTTDFPRALAPAEAAVRSDGVAVVRAGDTAVELLEGRSVEDDDMPLSREDLARLVAAARG